MDVSNECTRRITQVEGAVKAICNRLYVAEMTDRTQKDLAEQCVKLLEHVCQRETTAVYEAGGLHAMLFVVRQHGHLVHKDTLYSAMSVVQRLCSRVEPQNPNIKGRIFSIYGVNVLILYTFRMYNRSWRTSCT